MLPVTPAEDLVGSPERTGHLRKDPFVPEPKIISVSGWTGEYATEVSDASGTGLFDVRRRTWCRPLLERLDIPESGFRAVTNLPKYPAG